MKINRKWKQCTAVVMALILIATMSQWPTIVKASDSEGVVTIPDAGFESGVGNWVLSGSGTLEHENEVCHSGSACAIIKPSAIFANGESFTMTSKESISVTKGKTYTYGAYVALSGGTSQSVSVKLLSEDGVTVLNANSTVVKTEDSENSEWLLVQGCFTPEIENVKLQFCYQSADEWINNSSAAFDDVFFTLANEDFELVRDEKPEGWNASKAELSVETATNHNGSRSMHVVKDNLEEETFVDGTALYELNMASASDYQIKWGMWHSSKNSDAFARLDAVFYDENYQKLESVDGMRAMLSGEDAYSAWDEVATVTNIPSEAKYVAFSIVLSSGNVDAYFDDIFWNVYEEEERVADASVTGWSTNEVWYPEDETNDGNWQFRYYRTKINLSKPIEGTLLYLQVSADDSTGAYVDGNYVWGAIYVDGNLYTPAYTTRKESKTTYTYEINTGTLKDKQNIVVATRVLNCSSYAGYIMQGFAVMNKNVAGEFNYETIFKTEASNTVSSKLECTEPMDGNNYNEFATWTETGDNANWYGTDYDDSSWTAVESRGMVPYGNMGDVPFDWKHSDAFFIYDSAEDADGRDLSEKAGETVSVSIPGPYTDLYGFTYHSAKPSTPSTVKALLYDAEQYSDVNKTSLNVLATVDVNITWNSDQTGSVFEFTIPDYLPAGNYKMILQQVRYQNGMNTDNVFVNLRISEESGKSASTSKVVTENGAVRLKINDKTVSPMMYLRPNETAHYNYATMSSFKNTGISIYSTYNGFLDGKDGNPIWTAQDTIDYDAFDKDIYQTLNLNPNAMVMVNINLDAPDWWLTANEDQKVKLQDGTVINEVSFASTKYRTEAAAVVTQLVTHMTNASYKHRIAGVRLTAGRTCEWMNFNQSDDGYVYTMDYSTPMQTAFGGTLPTIDERLSEENGVLLNPSNQSAVIKYNEVLSQCVTDSLLTYAKAVKEVNANWIVGAYNGYLWNEGSSAGIGATHTTVEQVLDSKYIDFISSPINYSERISGYSTGYMALSESAASHGKLYMLEQDNRTLYGKVFSNGDAEGATYTLEETKQQLTRDTAIDLVKGNGLWYYDMQGGWYDHDEIEACIKALKAEYDYSLGMDMSTNSQVAVFIGSETYNYLANDTLDNVDSTNDSYKLMSQLYNAQRVELSKMGTSYDTYMIEDLTSNTATTDWSKYKLSIILSPFELTEAERTAISEKLQKNKNYVLWIYLPGVSDGSTMSAENIQKATGMAVTLSTEDTTLAAKISNDSFGVMDDTYGAAFNYNTPYVVINADGVTPLASYTNGNGIAAAMKACETYTSVYSAVPNVPADALRDLCTAAGVHMYTEDKDTVVETNASYVTVHSQVAGDKVVTLPENEWGYKVYDVLNKTDVTVTDCSFTATLSTAGDTGLYRITPMEAIEIANKDWNGVLIQNGNFADWSGEFPAGYGYNDNIKAAMIKSIDEEKGYVAKITDKNNIGELFFEYDVEVEAGKTYELSFDANYSGSSASAQAVYIVYNSDWSAMHSIADYTSIVNGAWNRVVATFDATTNETVHIRFALWNGGADAILKLTNLRLQVVGDDNLIPNGTFTDVNADSNTGYFGWGMGSDTYTGQGENIVKNGGMDTFLDVGYPGHFRLADWEARLDFITMEYAQGADGSENSAVKMISGDGTQVGGVNKITSQFIGDWQAVTLEENTEYTLSFTGKAESSTSVMFVQILDATTGNPALLNEVGQIAKAEIASAANVGTWQTTNITFDSGTVTNAYVMIFCYDWSNTTGGDIYYVDEVTLCQSNVSVKNTPTITKISNANIEGIQFGGGHLCFLGANTTAQTVANATYVLKMNTALTGTGTVNMSFLNTYNGWTSDYNFTVQTSEEVTAQRVLIPFTNSAVYEMRTTLLNADKNSLFSFGNVSLKLNRGDFDEDDGGYPDADDFSEMRKVLVGSEEATENAKVFAEMNADGKVDVLDLVRMKLYGARMK